MKSVMSSFVSMNTNGYNTFLVVEQWNGIVIYSSRGDRYLGHSSRHTQVPVPATILRPRLFLNTQPTYLVGILVDYSDHLLVAHEIVSTHNS